MILLQRSGASAVGAPMPMFAKDCEPPVHRQGAFHLGLAGAPSLGLHAPELPAVLGSGSRRVCGPVVLALGAAAVLGVLPVVLSGVLAEPFRIFGPSLPGVLVDADLSLWVALEPPLAIGQPVFDLPAHEGSIPPDGDQ